jgi:hypothetical protein
MFESCSSCPFDCPPLGMACLPEVCGNGIDDDDDGMTDEYCVGCGNGVCENGEGCFNCPNDCPYPENCNPDACGNGQCNVGAGEACTWCLDCDGLCECGDDNCQAPETAQNCPWDC